jgi:hypothetical protein
MSEWYSNRLQIVQAAAAVISATVALCLFFTVDLHKYANIVFIVGISAATWAVIVMLSLFGWAAGLLVGGLGGAVAGFFGAAWFYENGGALVVAGKVVGPDIRVECLADVIGQPRGSADFASNTSSDATSNSHAEFNTGSGVGFNSRSGAPYTGGSGAGYTSGGGSGFTSGGGAGSTLGGGAISTPWPAGAVSMPEESAVNMAQKSPSGVTPNSSPSGVTPGNIAPTGTHKNSVPSGSSGFGPPDGSGNAFNSSGVGNRSNSSPLIGGNSFVILKWPRGC